MKRANRTLAATAALAAAMTLGGFGLTAWAAPAPADKDHKHDHGHDHKHGEGRELGSQEIAGVTVRVTQIGEVKPGREAEFDMVVTGGKGKPRAIRAWIGAAEPGESIKARAEDEGKEYHVHVEVPVKLPADSKLWVEVETATGRAVGSFALAAAEKPKRK